MTCPTCERLGRACAYCTTLCPGVPDPWCACACHVADVEREATIQAEKISRIQL